jgi:hypothetical protein
MLSQRLEYRVGHRSPVLKSGQYVETKKMTLAEKRAHDL